MDQQKQQKVQSSAPGPSPAAEPKFPLQLPHPKPAGSVYPMTPSTRPSWPVVFTPLKPMVEVKSDTSTPTKRKRQCNCKASQCLKLYCECFAAGLYCDGCNCTKCGNKAENEKARQVAINNTKQRNPTAFQPKIENVTNTPSVPKSDAGAPSIPKHNKGCHCKKSGCLKKYCECFQANILCSKNCKCMDCKNFDGSEELQALIQGDNTSDRNNFQQAASVTLNGAVGPSGYKCPPACRKRPPEDLLGHRLNGEGSTMQSHFQEANHVDASQVAPSTGLEACIGNSQSKSKMVYRSPLANTIHPTDVNDLANHLVIACKKATEAFLTRADNKAEMEVDKSKKQEVQKAGDLESHCSYAQEDSRPASPGTQALMCDEPGTTFGTSTDYYRSSFPVAFHDHDTSELHALQEKAVLIGFRDYLRLLTMRGKINAANTSDAALELDARRHHGATTNLVSPKAVEKPKAPVNSSEHPKISQPSVSNG